MSAINNQSTNNLPVVRPQTRTKKSTSEFKKQQKEVRQVMLDQAVRMYTKEIAKSKNKNVSGSTFRTIMEAFDFPAWMTRHTIRYHYLKMQKDGLLENSPPVLDVTITETGGTQVSELTPECMRNKGGRPAGFKSSLLKQHKEKLEEAKVLASQEYQLRKKEKTKLGNGELKKIIIEKLKDVGLPEDNHDLIHPKTIVSRVSRGNLYGVLGSYSNTSPMASIEPVLAEICRHLNRMAKSITIKEFLALANDIIIDTDTEINVKLFQRKVCGITNNKTKLGKRYFYNFMKRHNDILHTSKITKRCVNRLEWGTYDNIKKMYKLVYTEMVAANVAKYIDPASYFDKLNNEVDAKDDTRYGTFSDIKITDPSYILFVDECGSSTNMRKDKTGNKKVIAEKGFSGTKAAISSDLRYTTMGFTAGNGDPIMCCVIMTSESQKGIPTSWITGIDITKIDDSFSCTINEDEIEIINKIKNVGSVAGGGPRCHFRGVDVPCFIQYSPHGGISASILTNCLRRMDELNLFPRVLNKKPFLLLDGHDSRFSLHFLNYIRDSNHPWSCCIGLPYGTHLWQVGDSKAQNGNYKFYEQEFKDKLLQEKTLRLLPLTLKPTDVVPIVNYAWERSFQVKKNNVKAILERGWFPANRSLLMHPDVLRTRKTSSTSNLTCTSTSNSTGTSTCTGTLSSSSQQFILSASSSSSTTDAIYSTVMNTGRGMAAALLEAAINKQSNNPEAMRKRKERLKLATTTRNVEAKTRKLTSGAAFFNDMVALHSDGI